MNQCKNCGASMADDAKFCLQCGAESGEDHGFPSKKVEPQKELEFLRPGLIGGAALGVLSGLPLIGAINILCCLWVQAGGGLAVYLLNQQRPRGLKYGDGALAGVISGLIGGIVSTIISIPVQSLMFNEQAAARAQEAMNQSQMPPGFRDFMSQMLSPGFNLSRTIITLGGNIVVFSLFAMIGGIIAVAVFNRKSIE